METNIEVNGKSVGLKINQISASKNIHQYKADIIRWLSRIGIDKEHIYFEHSYYGFKKAFAEIRWDVNGEDYYYRCDTQDNATSCVAAIEQLVHYEVIFIERGIKSFGQVMNQFRLGYEPDKVKLKTPREIVGVEESCKDLEYIEFKYKQKAKKLHPDQGGDDEEAMKELNLAKEALEKELR